MLGSSAPPWLRDSGVALDLRGFVATGPRLQSRSHAEAFGVGDVATRTDAPHPNHAVETMRDRIGAFLGRHRKFLAVN
jgi:sulfide:quinone oxidoreductase